MGGSARGRSRPPGFFGIELDTILMDRGLNIVDFTAQSGFEKVTIYRLLCNDLTPTPMWCERIADALKLPVVSKDRERLHLAGAIDRGYLIRMPKR